jgi:hypothetical protein
MNTRSEFAVVHYDTHWSKFIQMGPDEHTRFGTQPAYQAGKCLFQWHVTVKRLAPICYSLDYIQPYSPTRWQTNAGLIF